MVGNTFLCLHYHRYNFIFNEANGYKLTAGLMPHNSQTENVKHLRASHFAVTKEQKKVGRGRRESMLFSLSGGKGFDVFRFY